MSDIALGCSCGECQVIKNYGLGISDQEVGNAWKWLHADCPGYVRQSKYPPVRFEATMRTVTLRGPRAVTTAANTDG
mgnify:CR=1 FL=1